MDAILATELDGLDQRLPLYARLRDVLTRRITSGEWPPDVPLPSESALASAYGVSVGTMRKAMQQLVEEGLLERRQGSGTYVHRAKLDRSLFRFFRFSGAGQGSAIPQSRILSRAVAKMADFPEADLGLEANEDIIRIDRLRLWNNKPFLVEQIALPLKLFRPILDVEIEQMGPLLYPFYEKTCGLIVASAEEILTVSEADAATARSLRCRAGAAMIVFDRLARAHDRTPLEWRRTRGRGDQFSYRVEIH